MKVDRPHDQIGKRRLPAIEHPWTASRAMEEEERLWLRGAQRMPPGLASPRRPANSPSRPLGEFHPEIRGALNRAGVGAAPAPAGRCARGRRNRRQHRQR
jgi:hypothetical protein